MAWYDLKTQTEILNHKVFSAVLKAMGTAGLTGLDKLISFLILTEIERLMSYLEKGFQEKTWTDLLNEFNNITKNKDIFKGIKNRNSFVVGEIPILNLIYLIQYH